MTDHIRERRVPHPSGHITFSPTGELVTSGGGFADTNPSPNASAPAVPTLSSRRVFFDITRG